EMRTIRFHPRISWSPLPGESWHLTISRSGCRGVLGLVPQPLCMKFRFAQKRANLGSDTTTDQAVCQGRFTVSLLNLLLTFNTAFAVNICRMPEQPLHIEDLSGAREGIRILRLAGPLTLANVFGFQSKVRADTSHAHILDFTNVPLADSAGIGALVGAYVTRQKKWTQPGVSRRESAHPPGSGSHAGGKLLSFLRNGHRSRAGGLK